MAAPTATGAPTSGTRGHGVGLGAGLDASRDLLDVLGLLPGRGEGRAGRRGERTGARVAVRGFLAIPLAMTASSSVPTAGLTALTRGGDV